MNPPATIVGRKQHQPPLDPAILRLVEAIARGLAKEDHELETNPVASRSVVSAP